MENLTLSEEQNLEQIKSISRMIWLNKKITQYHKENLRNNPNIRPRALLDENCSSKKIMNKLRRSGWAVKLVRYAEPGLSDEMIVLSLFDDWKPHLFITFDKHFTHYDRFKKYYQGMIDEDGKLEKWLPIIYLLPSRLNQKPEKTVKHIQQRIKKLYFRWEDFKEFDEYIKDFHFKIITIKYETSSGIFFKENINTDIKDFDLSRRYITFISLQKLAGCINLQSINLARNGIENLILTPLKECLNLKMVNLMSNNLRKLDISPLVECNKLETLIIDKDVKLTIKGNLLEEEFPLRFEITKNDIH